MAGKPVLVSATQEQRSFVERYGVGEVAQDTTVESIREGVVRLMSRDVHALASAIERVRKEFSWEQQEAILKRIYIESLGFRGGKE